MSIVALIMNLLLVGLLLAALGMGWRLNRRLQVLRDSHEGFAAAVTELNVAAQRAEQGLADLRAATDEATDLLADRIEKGRALAAKLEKLMREAPEVRAAEPRKGASVSAASPVMPPRRDDTAEDRLGALLAAAHEARTGQPRPTPAPARRETAAPVRPVTPDEDLFDDPPLTLDRYAGARR